MWKWPSADLLIEILSPFSFLLQVSPVPIKSTNSTSLQCTHDGVALKESNPGKGYHWVKLIMHMV